jgi:hypothetical protein
MDRRRRQFKAVPTKPDAATRLKQAATQRTQQRQLLFQANRALVPADDVDKWTEAILEGWMPSAKDTLAVMSAFFQTSRLPYTTSALRFLDAIFNPHYTLLTDVERADVLRAHPLILDGISASMDDCSVQGDVSLNTLAAWALNSIVSTPQCAQLAWSHSGQPVYKILALVENAPVTCQPHFMVGTVATALHVFPQAELIFDALPRLAALATKPDTNGSWFLATEIVNTVTHVLGMLDGHPQLLFFAQASDLGRVCKLICTELPWREVGFLVEAALGLLMELSTTVPTWCLQQGAVTTLSRVFFLHPEQSTQVMWVMQQLLTQCPVDALLSFVEEPSLMEAVCDLVVCTPLGDVASTYALQIVTSCMPDLNMPVWKCVDPAVLATVQHFLISTKLVDTLMKAFLPPMSNTSLSHVVQRLTKLFPHFSANPNL